MDHGSVVDARRRRIRLALRAHSEPVALYAVYVVIGLAFAGTSPVVLAGRLGLVRQTPRHGARRGHRECRCRSHRPPAGDPGVDSGGGLARRMSRPRPRDSRRRSTVVARFVREPHGHFLRTHSGHPGMVSSALRSRIFWTLLVVVFGMTLALNGVVVHLPALLVDRGLPASQAVAVMSAMGGASVAGRLLTGWLIDSSMRNTCRSCCSR